MEDLRRADWGRDSLQGLREIYYFYLDEERRSELARMGRIRRSFSLLAWLIKSLFLKLSPARRLMLLLSLVLMIGGRVELIAGTRRLDIDFHPFAFVILLVVLMLELRDKLLARDEIQVARDVQLALLPQTHPTIPGWEVWSCSRPANDVGGDLVDYIEIDGFRHGVLVGDVSGKGLGAALLSARLQATLRALLPDSPTLADLGGRTNAIFHRDGLDNRYATLFFAEVQHHSGDLRYLNAGHNPPYLVRREGIERLPPSSYPLGMLGSASYEEGAARLEPGEMVVAYSDGLTEATNAEGEEFGIARVESLLPGLRGRSPAEAGQVLLDAVERFLGDSRAADDLSLVILRRR